MKQTELDLPPSFKCSWILIGQNSPMLLYGGCTRSLENMLCKYCLHSSDSTGSVCGLLVLAPPVAAADPDLGHRSAAS